MVCQKRFGLGCAMVLSGLVGVVSPAVAAAAEPEPVAGPAAPPPSEPSAPGRPLPPLHIDIRATFSTDVLLVAPGVGLSGDVGLLPIGPGVLSAGLGIDYDICGSVCWFFSAVTPLEFSQRQIWPTARVAYHLGFKGADKLDFYPFVVGGPVFAESTIEVDNGLAKYTGTDTGIGVGAGAGMNLFVAGPLFLTGEGKIRYARGSYSYKLTSGDGSIAYDSASVDTWSLTGLEIRLGLGVRLP